MILNGHQFVEVPATSAGTRSAAESVGILMQSSKIKDSTDFPGSKELDTRTSSFCAGEDLSQDEAIDGLVCTAWYIGNDKFVTAGHCILPSQISDASNPRACSNFSVVLGVTTATGPLVEANHVYSCSRVVAHGGVLPPDLVRPICGPGIARWPACRYDIVPEDWAVFEVNGPVDPTILDAPLAVAAPYDIKVNQPSLLIGHPDGSLMKADETAVVRAVHPEVLFGAVEYEATSARGNSGSPVLDRKTGVAFGIDSAFGLTPGNFDPVRTGDTCHVHTRCGTGGVPCAPGRAASAWNIFFPQFEPDGFHATGIAWEDGMAFALPGDWNLDGQPDALVFRRIVGFISVTLRTGPLPADSTQIGVIPFSGSSDALPLVASADFTGDSSADLVMVADNTPLFFSASQILSLVTGGNPNATLPPASGLAFLQAGFVGMSAGDVNGDGISDLRAFRSSGASEVFCGGSSGLSQTCSGASVLADVDGDGDVDRINLSKSGTKVAWATKLNPTGGFGNPTDATYTDPIVAVAGNFNGDTASGGLPRMDVAFLSGGVPFYLLATGFGGMSARPLDSRPDYVKLRVTDATGDGIDDIEAVRADGTVRVFPGRSGDRDSGGPSTTGIDFGGMPNGDSGDGRFFVTSGGLGTDLKHMSLLVQLDAATTNVNLQLFDGDFGGLFDDFDEATRYACYALHAAPDGAPPDDPTSGALLTLNEANFSDGVWRPVYNGPPHSAARTGAGQPYFYRLEIYFASTDTCGDVVGEENATNAFKVRVNGAVIWDTGDVEIMTRDSLGDFGGGTFASTADTDFDGTWDMLIDVGSASSGEIQLLDRDADRADATIPGNPPQPGLSYTLTPLDPNAAFYYGWASPDGPSGNFPDEEVVSFSTTGNGVDGLEHNFGGLWRWRWENVRAGNDLHLGIVASPPRYASTGGLLRRLSPSSARAASAWQADSARLSAALPIVVGHGAGTVTVTTVGVAGQILAKATSGTAIERLRAELLAARLNLVTAGAGETLSQAHVYGKEVIVSDVVAEADGLLANPTATADAMLASARLLRAVNGGEVSYVPVDTTRPAAGGDSDGDGVDNVHDNCPAVANATQADADQNGIGDVCDPTPTTECVIDRGNGKFTAFFNYSNPFRERILKGAANRLTGATPGAVPPAILRRGANPRALAVGSSGSSVTWTVLGQTATASLSSPRCTGDVLLTLGLPADTALYGRRELKIGDRVSIPDCSTAVSGAAADVAADARVGEVVTGGNALLHDRVAACGVIRANGTVTLQNGVTTGGVLQHQTTSLPLLDWRVTFPASAQDVTLQPDATSTLAPGSYRNITINARATLTLSAGTYFFDSLDIEAQGKVIANQAGGTVIVYVKRQLIWHGDLVASGGPPLLVGYFGTLDVTVERAFTGTLIAPSARVILGSSPATAFTGRFLADRLEVRPDAVIRRP